MLAFAAEGDCIMKVYVYLRVSTDQQQDSGAGLSAQEDACRQWAQRKGVSIEKIFIEEAVSGSVAIDGRPALKDAISSMRKGDVLLVSKRDRLGRDVRNLVKIEDEVKARKGRIISAAGEGTDSDGTNDIFMRGIFDLVSQHERNIIRDRTKAALQAKKARGERVGYVPFGYRLCADQVHIEKDEREQDVIRQISELRRDGFSTREIAYELNLRAAFNRGGAKWNHASIHRAMTKLAA